MKKLITLVLCMALALSFIACTQQTAPAAAPAEAAAPAAAPATEAAPAAEAAPAEPAAAKTIYVIVKVLGNQYWSVVQAGAEKAGADLGCNVVILGTAAESDIEGQVRFLQDAVSSKADGIVIAPLDRTALQAPIAEQYKSGIPIVLIDSTVDGEDFSCALLTDNIEAGRMAAKELIAKLQARGIDENADYVVAIQAGSTGSQAINDRLLGFNEYWSANAPAKWVVLNDDIKINDGDISKAVGFCQDFLTTYPNIIAMFGPNNGSTVGFVTGLTEANRTDVTLMGFDFSAEMETMIRSGKFDVSSVVQRQYNMGYDGVKTALELANGGTVAQKIVDTGVLLVDPTNVDSADVQGLINPGK